MFAGFHRAAAGVSADPLAGVLARAFRLGVLTLLVAGVVAGCSVFGDPPEDPPAELPDFDSTLRIRKAWSAGLGDGTESLRLALAPASDGSRIFAASNEGIVQAFDAVKGKRLWRSKTKLPLSAGPGTDGKLVVAGSSNGEIIALSAEDGRELWRKAVPSEVLAAPALAGDLVLIRTVDGKLTAFSAADGSQRWFVQQAMPRLSVRGTAAPAVVRSTVIAGFDNGRVAAYESTDGSQLWEVLVDPPAGRNEVERMVDVNATVQAAGDDLYAVAYQGRVSALALESGQVLWSAEIPSHSGLAVDADSLYVSGQDSTLTAVARAGGAESWKSDVLKNRDITGPAAYKNSVVVGDFEGYVHWFEASSGKLQGRGKAGGGRVTSTPLVVNDLLYVQTDGGKLVAFSVKPR